MNYLVPPLSQEGVLSKRNKHLLNTFSDDFAVVVAAVCHWNG